MKRIIALISFSTVALAGGTAFAAHYGWSGCGLGSQIMGPENTVINQTLAATTNGTSANQTFAMTSGTSNCLRDGIIVASIEQEAFFEANLEKLQRDMARGGGEHLSALTSMLSCDDSVHALVNEAAQQGYQTVFPNMDTTSKQALYTFKLQLSQNSKIANSCML